MALADAQVEALTRLVVARSGFDGKVYSVRAPEQQFRPKSARSSSRRQTFSERKRSHAVVAQDGLRSGLQTFINEALASVEQAVRSHVGGLEGSLRTLVGS